MKSIRNPVLSRHSRIGYSPLPVTLVAGSAASAMEIWGHYSVATISLSVVALTTAIALWSQIASHRRAAKVRNRLHDTD